MATLAVLVHHDPRGRVAPHVMYQVNWLRGVSDRLVIVSSSGLVAKERRRLDAVDRIHEVGNRGYDFYAWRQGLLREHSPSDYRSIILANDSYVGPLVSGSALLDDMYNKRADTYGISMSKQFTPHVQSFFSIHGPGFTQLPQFLAFWQGMRPLADRQRVISAYELGLGRLAQSLQLKMHGYFESSSLDQRTAAARLRAVRSPGPARPAVMARAWIKRPRDIDPDSPMFALWDRALDGRLPAVKVSLFRRNPYRLDLRSVLGKLEYAHPTAFEGFRGYLNDTGTRV